MMFATGDEDVERAGGELGYIEQVTGTEIEEPEDEEILRVAQEYKIPIGIDDRLLELAQRQYDQSVANNDADSAEYYKEIYGAFVEDEDT